MPTPLAQRMLECLYHDAGVRQTAKDALADWILDTQPRTRPLDPTALVDHHGCQHHCFSFILPARAPSQRPPAG